MFSLSYQVDEYHHLIAVSVSVEKLMEAAEVYNNSPVRWSLNASGMGYGYGKYGDFEIDYVEVL